METAAWGLLNLREATTAHSILQSFQARQNCITQSTYSEACNSLRRLRSSSCTP